jgi:hypothetical protein
MDTYAHVPPSPSSTNWVRNVISSGFRIPFTHPPPVQARPPQPGSTATDIQEASAIEREILSLLAKRAVEEVHPSSYGFRSRLFTIPKKTGDLRPVLNLRHSTNTFLDATSKWSR